MPESLMAQLERHLRERWQRIECWRQAHTPEVGNLYLIDGRLYLDRVPMPVGRELQDVIMYPPKHRSSWKNLGRLMPAFRGLPYDLYPRGRVVYFEAVADADSIQQIMTAMHLSRDQTEVRLAAHDRTRNPWQDPGAASQSGNYEPYP